MTMSKIYLLDNNGKTLAPMNETGYVSESDLQVFLADHPDLLPGDQIDPESPRRWLLVSREMGVPGDVDETSRWSLDHLFLDQDGIPTFVECKRSQDTRARREVVAQMLDYAANGIEYWSLDRIRQSAAKTATLNGVDLDELILDLVDVDAEDSVEVYWQAVEHNLRNGKVRLIFVLDQSTKELRRLVEFLNDKMADVEVLIVEIRQYLGGERTALVPRVLGISEQARSTKQTVLRGPRIDRAYVLNTCAAEARSVFEAMLDRGDESPYRLYWGRKGFSIRAFDENKQAWYSFAYGWPEKNRFDFYFRDIPGAREEVAILRKEMLETDIFTESGKHTLIATISTQNHDKILQVFAAFAKSVMNAGGTE